MKNPFAINQAAKTLLHRLDLVQILLHRLDQVQILHQQNVHLHTAAAIALVKIYAKMSAINSRDPTTAFGVHNTIHPIAIN